MEIRQQMRPQEHAIVIDRNGRLSLGFKKDLFLSISPGISLKGRDEFYTITHYHNPIFRARPHLP